MSKTDALEMCEYILNIISEIRESYEEEPEVCGDRDESGFPAAYTNVVLSRVEDGTSIIISIETDSAFGYVTGEEIIRNCNKLVKMIRASERKIRSQLAMIHHTVVE